MAEVDLNKADLHSLMRLGLDREVASSIIALRPFLNWDDLKRVPDLDAARIQKLKDRGAILGGPLRV